MGTFINQTFTFQEAKSIFNLLSNTITMQVFFDAGTAKDKNKISVVAHDINAIQASMFLAAIDAECEVKIVSVSDGFEFTLALNAAMNKTVQPTKDVEYTDDEENQMYGMAYEAMINER
jgi:hypothetical protein